MREATGWCWGGEDGPGARFSSFLLCTMLKDEFGCWGAELCGRRRFDSDTIRPVTLGSNFTVRIFCQVQFCRCKISGLELVFSVVDLDFRAVD